MTSTGAAGTVAPSAHLTRDTIALRDGETSVLRWRADAGAPRIVFSHGNGFTAFTHRSLLERLAGRFDIAAPDLRGHGASRLPRTPMRMRSFDVYRDDLLDFLERDGRPPYVLAGHSMGGVASLFAAVERPDLVSGLIVFEPVCLPSIVNIVAASPLWPWVRSRVGWYKMALRRRSAWPARAVVLEDLAQKPIFARWADGVLADFVESGLVDAEGGVELACSPEWEAAAYVAHAHDFWGRLKQCRTPITALRAANGSTFFPGQARRFLRCAKTAEIIDAPAGTTHLLPMERPDFCADALLRAAAAFSAGRATV